MNEPESVKFLGAMINGQRQVVAANSKAGAMQAAFAIYTNLRWQLKKRDYTKAEAVKLIEEAMTETKKKVLHDEVCAEAIAKYQVMINQLRAK